MGSPESMTVGTVPRVADLTGHGQVVCGTSATALPDVSARVVVVKAAAANVGTVYIGTSSGVTAVTGSTNTTTGLQLSADQGISLAVPSANLSGLHVIGTDAGDSVTYIAWR